MSKDLSKYCKSKINKSEKEIELEIRHYLQRVLGAYVLKMHGSAFVSPGIPDLICCLNGFFFGIEVKANKGIVSSVQKVHIRNIKKTGGSAMIAKGDNALYDVVEWLENEGII